MRLCIYILLISGSSFVYNHIGAQFPLLFTSTVEADNVPASMQTPFSISKGNPIKLLIPKIGVSANIVTVGTTTSGNLDVPQNLLDVGWYKGGNRPGDFGNAVIDGHEVDELGFGAVFKKLHLLESGDEVIVLTDKNEKLIFNVLKKETYDYDDAPMKDIFGGSVSKNLNLITCAGNYIYKAKTKDKRLVIFTTEKVE